MPQHHGFGKFQVLARLATGGAANIFLARQPGAAGFRKLVCLKTLLPERSRDPDFLAMFLDEARLAALLHHPNCVQVYDLGKADGVYYISMEYILGETLWGLLSTVAKTRKALPRRQVAAVIASACEGLHHAHELKTARGEPYNLVHRDVSPQNIMVTYEGQTKILDFGILKAETGRAETMSGIVKGKFSYMSPEQIAGAAVDRRSDVYSLGIVLFECLASRRLYRAESPEDIAHLILDQTPPRLSDIVPHIPPALDSIVSMALAKDPAHRFQTAQDMGDALRSYLDSVRYVHTSTTIAKLLDERFHDRIEARGRVYEAALAGEYDETELLRALDASPVRALDLKVPDEVGLSYGAADDEGLGFEKDAGVDSSSEAWSMEAMLALEVAASDAARAEANGTERASEHLGDERAPPASPWSAPFRSSLGASMHSPRGAVALDRDTDVTGPNDPDMDRTEISPADIVPAPHHQARDPLSSPEFGVQPLTPPRPLMPLADAARSLRPPAFAPGSDAGPTVVPSIVPSVLPSVRPPPTVVPSRAPGLETRPSIPRGSPEGAGPDLTPSSVHSAGAYGALGRDPLLQPGDLTRSGFRLRVVIAAGVLGLAVGMALGLLLASNVF